MTRRMGRALWVLPVLLLAAGCDESLEDLTGPTPNLEPTLSSIQREIFDKSDESGRLACTQCHIPGGIAAGTGLILTEGNSYANLVNRASSLKPGETRVIPDDPDRSYFIRKLEGGPDIIGVRMPRGNGPFLTEGQMLVIRTWIQRGALNN
jgi:hypothetical protein